MKCASCKKDAKYWCSHCMRHTYCGEACQRSHYPEHVETCVPFYFVAGGSSEEDRKKRPRNQGKEQEEQAENAYVRLYAAYKRTKDETLVAQLEEYFGRMSEEARRRYVDGLPCHSDRDPISLEDINALEADNVVYLMEANIKYCYELDALVGYIHSSSQRDAVYGRRDPVHPVSRQPFTAEEMHRIDDAAKTRLVTLWGKFRTFTDVALLSEVVEKLQVMYAAYVPADILTGAKRTRLEKELKEVHAKGLCSYVVAQWPLLRLLDCQVSDVEWRRIKKDNVSVLVNLFETEKDLRTAFNTPTFVEFCAPETALLTALVKKFYPDKDPTSDPIQILKGRKRGAAIEFAEEFGITYEMDINGDVFDVEPRENETIRDMYDRVFDAYNFAVIPNNPDLVNETWLLINTKWEDSDGWDSTTDFELAWPGDPYVEEDDDTVRLRVAVEYLPPSIELVYHFPSGLAHLKPNDVQIDPDDVMGSTTSFLDVYNVWPAWGNINTAEYKTKIVYEFSSDRDREEDVTVYDNITEPYSWIHSALQEFSSDNNLAGPAYGETRWTVHVYILPNLDEAYQKGFEFFASKWDYYKNTLGATYADVEWDKMKYGEKEVRTLVRFFTSIEELELALHTSKSLNRVFDLPYWGKELWAALANWHCRFVDNPFQRDDCLAEKLQRAREKRERLERFRAVNFVLETSVQSYDDAHVGVNTYKVVVDTPEKLEDAYRRTYLEHVREMMPAYYREAWLQIRSVWGLDNPIAYATGSLAFVWPGMPFEPWRDTVRLAIDIIPGPFVELRVTKMNAWSRLSTSVQKMDGNTIMYFFNGMPNERRQQFLARFENMWMSTEAMLNIEDDNEWETFVSLSARVGLENRDYELSTSARKGFIIRDIRRSPFEDVMRFIKSAALDRYVPEPDGREKEFNVTVELRKKK